MKQDQFHINELPKEHTRNAWQPGTEELHMNVIVLREGEQIAKHVNQVLDVIVTCLRGSGTITLNENQIDVESGSIVLIKQGIERVIQAGSDGMVYTTVHRKRGGIMPTMSRP